MKRFSKALVTLLVVITILGTLSVGFAAPSVPSDVKGTDYEDAYTRLAALGIMSGFPDGTFKPGDPLTRAQAARIVVAALGLDKAAELAKGATAYTDVPADHWASGYINVANSLGIIAGMGDGTFQPEANVTYAQILKMMLMAMNYGPALKKATWPTGYIAMADQIGLSDDVNVAANVPAVRGDVAVIVNNALDIPMLKQEGYGDLETYKPAEPNENYNILHEKLKVTEYTGRVTATPEVDPSLEEKHFKVGSTDLKVADDINVEEYLGLEVTAWKKDGKVFFVSIDTAADDILTGVVTIDASTGKLKINGSKYVENDDALIYVNNDNISDNAKELTAYKNGDGKNLQVYGRYVIDGDKVVFASVFGLSDKGIVDSVDAHRNKVYTTLNDSDVSVAIDPDDDVIYKAGEKIAIDDIQEGDVLYSVAPVNGSYTNIYIVVADKVEGNLDKVKASKITIDGKDYDTVIAVSSSLAGDEVVATLGIDGKVIKVESVAAEETSFYATVVKEYDLETAKIKVMKADGTKVTYELVDEKDLDDVNPNDVVKVTLNSDGQIKKGGLVKVVAAAALAANQGTVTSLNKDRDYVKTNAAAFPSFYVTNSTAIFTWDGTAFDVTDWATIEKVGTPTVITLYAKTKDLKAELLVVTSGLSTLVEKAKYGYISDIWEDANGYVFEFNLGNGEDPVTYTINTEGTITASVYQDHFATFKVNAEGDVNLTDITVLTASDFTNGTVKAKDGRFLTVTQSGVDHVYYVDEEASIFTKNADGDVVAGTLADVGKGDNIDIILGTGDEADTILFINVK